MFYHKIISEFFVLHHKAYSIKFFYEFMVTNKTEEIRGCN